MPGLVKDSQHFMATVETSSHSVLWTLGNETLLHYVHGAQSIVEKSVFAYEIYSPCSSSETPSQCILSQTRRIQSTVVPINNKVYNPGFFFFFIEHVTVILKTELNLASVDSNIIKSST